ncbi:hypothetical protein M0Q50_03160 [bacterium]|jgi:hypothetical protein|nr:hypothetical protein [bacterium]
MTKKIEDAVINRRLSILMKEAEIIQGIIKRKSNHSFLIKGWTVSLLVATLILQGQKEHILIAFIPLLAFWFLDAHYLQRIRRYKNLYKWNIENRLKTEEYIFDININDRFGKTVSSRPQLMFSEKLRWFYGSLFIITIIYYCIVK